MSSPKIELRWGHQVILQAVVAMHRLRLLDSILNMSVADTQGHHIRASMSPYPHCLSRRFTAVAARILIGCNFF